MTIVDNLSKWLKEAFCEAGLNLVDLHLILPLPTGEEE
jgi:hypothetical protein